MDSNDMFTGKGRVQPKDALEFAEVMITVCHSQVKNACFTCSDHNRLKECLQTVCRVIIEKPVEHLFQMNNNAVYYQLETPLKREELYLASMAVLAVKRAAADWSKKNGIPVQDSCCGCV